MKIELKNVALQYAGKPPLFQGVNLIFHSSDFLLIRGPSGSGKSSFLRLLNHLQNPSEGEIWIDDRPAKQHNILSLRRRIGYVQQTPVMISGTVKDNLMLPFRYKIARAQVRPNDDELRQKLDAYLLADVQLEDSAEKLSVGQKQRVALIRTLISKPDLLLCDEPTSALDEQSRQIVETEITRPKLAIGVVLVTHLDFQPQRVSLRKFILDSNGLQEVTPCT